MTSVIDFPRPDPSLPPEIKDASAWYGPDLKESADWIARLSEAEIAEVESAAKELAESSINLTSIGSDDFPLPTLGPRLRDLMETARLARAPRRDAIAEAGRSPNRRQRSPAGFATRFRKRARQRCHRRS